MTPSRLVDTLTAGINTTKEDFMFHTTPEYVAAHIQSLQPNPGSGAIARHQREARVLHRRERRARLGRLLVSVRRALPFVNGPAETELVISVEAPQTT
jgi:hypothetical protein